VNPNGDRLHQYDRVGDVRKNLRLCNKRAQRISRVLACCALFALWSGGIIVAHMRGIMKRILLRESFTAALVDPAMSLYYLQALFFFFVTVHRDYHP
jgi:hypothetical protein